MPGTSRSSGATKNATAASYVGLRVWRATGDFHFCVFSFSLKYGSELPVDASIATSDSPRTSVTCSSPFKCGARRLMSAAVSESEPANFAPFFPFASGTPSSSPPSTDETRWSTSSVTRFAASFAARAARTSRDSFGSSFSRHFLMKDFLSTTPFPARRAVRSSRAAAPERRSASCVCLASAESGTSRTRRSSVPASRFFRRRRGSFRAYEPRGSPRIEDALFVSTTRRATFWNGFKLARLIRPVPMVLWNRDPAASSFSVPARSSLSPFA